MPIKIDIETERLIISPVTKSNYENVTKLFAESRNSCYATGIFDEVSENEVEKRISLNNSTDNGFCLSAKRRDKKEIIGFLMGSLSQKDAAVWLNILVISDSSRRNGYAKELVEAVTGFFAEKYKILRVGLSVLDDNYIGNKFWKSLGYEISETLLKSGVVGDGLSKINIFVKLF